METFLDASPKIYTLDQVETNKNYAVIITTLSGLYRYVIGDTVKFTNTKTINTKLINTSIIIKLN